MYVRSICAGNVYSALYSRHMDGWRRTGQEIAYMKRKKKCRPRSTTLGTTFSAANFHEDRPKGKRRENSSERITDRLSWEISEVEDLSSEILVVLFSRRRGFATVYLFLQWSNVKFRESQMVSDINNIILIM